MSLSSALPLPLSADDAAPRPDRPRWAFWRSPAGQPRVGPAGAARHRGGGGAAVRAEHRRGRAGPVLLGRGQEHVGELEGVLLRGLRPRRDDHHRQARRVVPAAGPVRAYLRLPSLVAGPAAGDRGRRLRAGDVPRGAPLGRAGPGAAGRRDLRGHPDRGVHVRAQHGGRRADHVPGAGGRQLAARRDGGPAALAVLGGRLGRARLPGQDAAGLDDPAGAGARLPAGRAGRPGPAAVAPRRGRPGDAGRLAVLDRALHGHPGRRPALRGRVHGQQRDRDGVRVQRRGTLRDLVPRLGPRPSAAGAAAAPVPRPARPSRPARRTWAARPRPRRRGAPSTTRAGSWACRAGGRS